MNKTTDAAYLTDLGLSQHEALAYLALTESGALSVAEVAKHISVLPNAVYRLLTKLQGCGMITEIATSPRKYQAVPPKAAIIAYERHSSMILSQSGLRAIEALTKKSRSEHTLIDFVVGQKQFFKKYVDFAKQAKTEILVISIGEPVPDEVKLATRDALEKGVKVKFLFHKYNESNESLLKSWVAMGVNVSYYPDGGFHLLVFDGIRSVLVASNPKETNERTGMVITSPSLSSALRDFFYARWGKALSINK